MLIVHEPTSLYVGPGFVLGARADAVAFEDEDTAARLLARHASEPCFSVVDADRREVA